MTSWTVFTHGSIPFWLIFFTCPYSKNTSQQMDGKGKIWERKIEQANYFNVHLLSSKSPSKTSLGVGSDEEESPEVGAVPKPQ